MYLTHRRTQVKDLETCFSILEGRHLFDAKSRKEILAFWRHLVEGEACVSVVVEDRRLPRNRRQVGFGLSFFATDEFFQRAKTDLPPFVGLYMAQKWRLGPRPFLLRKEIDKANAGPGLNDLGLASGWDTVRLSPEDVLRTQGFLQQSFLETHRGYRLKELIIEALGAPFRDLFLASGCSLRRDYKELWGKPLLKHIMEKDHPYLMGCTAEEARNKHGSFAAVVFEDHSPPRFHFSGGERKTLEKALLGETDNEIAASLEVSTWAVKKRWQAIYQKVMAVDADLLAEMPKPKAKDNPTRQRRRFLLDYLRTHTEEVRAVPSGGKK